MRVKYYPDTDTLSIMLAEDLITPFGEMPRENVTLMLSEDGKLGEIVIDHASGTMDVEAVLWQGIGFEVFSDGPVSVTPSGVPYPNEDARLATDRRGFDVAASSGLRARSERKGAAGPA